MKSNIFKSNNVGKTIDRRFIMEPDDNVESSSSYRKKTDKFEKRSFNQRQNQDYAQVHNSFIDEKERKKKMQEKKLVMNDVNYPVLLNDSDNSDKKEDNKLTSSFNFADAVKKEKIIEYAEEEKVVEKVPPGCVKVCRGANGKFIFEYGESTIKEFDEKWDEYDKKQQLSIIRKKLENQRIDYIRKYGIDNYENYCIPSFESDSEDEYE